MRQDRILQKFAEIQNNTFISGIRGGLVMAIPILLIGSFSLIINTFVSSLDYTGTWLETIYDIFSVIYDGTFGILSIFISFFICYSYMQKKTNDVYIYGAPICSVAGLVILSGGLEAGIKSGSFEVYGMFTAIVCALISSALYPRFSSITRKKILFTYGGDFTFQHILNHLLPAVGTITFFGIFNQMIRLFFQTDSFQSLFIYIINAVFSGMGRGPFSSALFVLLSSILWFFGIHGSNVLDNVCQNLFVPAIEENIALIAAGAAPTEIFSKSFLDSFVLMGGCGASMALLISLFLFSKNPGNRRLTRIAALPMLFNVNELMVFGLPIVLNPVFLIPFLLIPFILLLTSAGAIYIGLVPVPVHSVGWTTPIFISGYLATGSIAGSLLQLFNLILGIFIYRPFVKLFDKLQHENTKLQIRQLTECLQQAEETGDSIKLTDRNDSTGLAARHLAFDLEKLLQENQLMLYYQPQFDEKDCCIGAEALLRWIHPSYGMIYPPLIIQLAREMNFLSDLEKYVFSYVCRESCSLRQILGEDTVISLNITPETLKNSDFISFLQTLSQSPDFRPGSICIEVTEQTELGMNEAVEALFKELHRIGFLLAIDDFSMGSTSLKYLQNNQFDVLKLDGSLVRNLENDPNAREIILSIISLAHALHIQVLAEYTETRQLQKALEKIGCTQYQGYLYSPAVPLSQLEEVLAPYKTENNTK